MESSTSPDIKTSPDNGDELKKSTGDQTKLPSSPFRKLAGFVTRTPPRERRNVAKTRYAIEVKVIKAKDLAAKDDNGFSDPFVVIKITNGKKSFQTKTIQRELNPEWNEDFSFTSDLDTNSELVLTLWDRDLLKTNDILGEVRIKLGEMMENGENNGKEVCYEVKPREGHNDKNIKGTLYATVTLWKEEEENSSDSNINIDLEERKNEAGKSKKEAESEKIKRYINKLEIQKADINDKKKEIKIAKRVIKEQIDVKPESSEPSENSNNTTDEMRNDEKEFVQLGDGVALAVAAGAADAEAPGSKVDSTGLKNSGKSKKEDVCDKLQRNINKVKPENEDIYDKKKEQKNTKVITEEPVEVEPELSEPSNKRNQMLENGKEFVQAATPIVARQMMAAAKLGAGVALAVAAGAADAGAPGSGMAVSAAFGIVEACIGVAIEIGKLVRQAVVNKEQSRRLGETVIIVQKALEGIVTQCGDVERLLPALKDLNITLTDALKFIGKFTDRGWFMKILNANLDNENFQTYHENLHKQVSVLTMAITAQMLESQGKGFANLESELHSFESQIAENIKKSQEDLKIDLQEIISGQNKILEDNREIKQELMKGLKKDDLESVLQLQMTSMEEQLKKWIEGLASSRPYSINPKENEESQPCDIDKNLHIPYCTFTIQEKIDNSSLGDVYLGTWNEQPVAIKMIADMRTKQNIKGFISDFQREIRIHSRLRSKRVVQVYGACLEEGRWCMVMEYMEGRTLEKYLCPEEEKYFNHLTNLTVPHRMQLAIEIAEGLYYLHSKGVLHHNLTSASIEIDGDGHAKLTDFGLAKDVEIETMITGRGNMRLAYKAPELWSGNHMYTAPSDVFSFGIILYEILTAQKPYTGMSDAQIATHINLCIHGEENLENCLPFPKNFDPCLQTLITQCWDVNVCQRPELMTILNHLRTYRSHVDSRIPRGIFSPSRLYYLGIKAHEEGRHHDAQALYQRAAEYGHMEAQTQLAFLLLQGLVDFTHEEPKSNFLESKEGGKLDCFSFDAKRQAFAMLSSSILEENSLQALAMYNLAHQLEKGFGVEKDEMEAKLIYEKTLLKTGMPPPDSIGVDPLLAQWAYARYIVVSKQ